MRFYCLYFSTRCFYFHNESAYNVYVSSTWYYPNDSTSLLTKGTWWEYISSGKSYRFVADPEAIINFAGHSGGSWKTELEYFSYAGILSFFVINEECYNLLESAYTFDDYPVLVRYDLTIDDLERLNYKVEYPPTERMYGVHMYPPYELVVTK